MKSKFKNRLVLTQGQRSNSYLTKLFKRETDSILIGSGSFKTGFSIPAYPITRPCGCQFAFCCFYPIFPADSRFHLFIFNDRAASRTWQRHRDGFQPPRCRLDSHIALIVQTCRTDFFSNSRPILPNGPAAESAHWQNALTAYPAEVPSGNGITRSSLG